jgi:hypothetical protein
MNRIIFVGWVERSDTHHCQPITSAVSPEATV